MCCSAKSNNGSRIIYKLRIDENQPTSINYTNTNVCRYISARDPDYTAKYSRLWFGEISMQISWDYLRQCMSDFIDCCKENGVDRTDLYKRSQEYYRLWDGESRIYLVDSVKAKNLLSNIEAGISNFLHHANILSNGIAELSVELCKVNSVIWPTVNNRIQKQDRKGFLNEISKLLGRDYLSELKNSMQLEGKQFSEKDVVNELSSLSMWRDASTHSIYLFANLQEINKNYEIVFSDSLNPLIDKSTVEFSNLDLERAFNRFTDFIKWWCMKVERFISEQ